MHNMKKLSILLLLSWSVISNSQSLIRAYPDSIVLQNKQVRRVLQIERNALYTVSYQNLLTQADYSRPGSDEFAFAINGKTVSSGASSGCFA